MFLASVAGFLVSIVSLIGRGASRQFDEDHDALTRPDPPPMNAEPIVQADSKSS